MATEGIDVFWFTEQDRVKKREYHYNGPVETYKIIDYSDEESFTLDNGRLKLNIEEEYFLGLDMSLTQSGIAIVNKDWEVISMIDLLNNETDKAVYYRHLRAFLSSNFGRMKIKLCVLEEQIKTENGMMIYGKMSELQGAILQMTDIFRVGINRIKPNVWKSVFLADDRYKGKRQKTLDSKISAGVEVETRFPRFEIYISALTHYSKSSQGYICDSCDAVGAMLGYLELNYGNDKTLQTRIVNKSMEYEANHHITRQIYAVDFKTNTARWQNRYTKEIEVTDIPNIFVNERRYRGLEILKYNSKLDIDENTRRCTSSYNEVCFIVCDDSKSCTKLEWESGVTKEPHESMMIVCHPTNKVKKSSGDFF